MTANYYILVVIEGIYNYELKSNYLQKHKFFAQFFFNFWNQHKFFNVLKKKKWASEVNYFASYWLRKSWFKCITKLVVNESQKLLKSAEKHFGSVFFLFRAKLSYKKLFLIRSEILGLLVNMLLSNYAYSRSNREHLPLPI